MVNDSQQSEPRVKRAWGVILAWIGGISAVVGFIATLTGTFGKIQDHFHGNGDLRAKMAMAQSQSQQGDYQSSVGTYTDILKSNSLDKPALDGQVNATMLWVENFSVTESEGQNTVGLGGTQLDQIFPILEAALSRSKGRQAADVEAHLGWAHWLNQHIAEREFGPIAERDLRGALTLDPSNVYANAMLGNWLLQNGGNLGEAVAHFNAAVATGNARPLVRTMQMGGLASNDSILGHVESMRAANDMRKDNEPLDERYKSQILFECFGPDMEDQARLTASLSALPPDDSWQTYLWLDDEPREGDDAKAHLLTRDFVQADLLEISNRHSEALASYRTLQQQLRNQNSTLQGPVDRAILRLSHK